MAEPTSTGQAGAALLAVAVASIGPHAGPWVIILIGAAAGAYVALGFRPRTSRWDAFRYWLRSVLFSAIFCSLLTYVAARHWELPEGELLPVMAGLLSMFMAALYRRVEMAVQAAAAPVEGPEP